MTRFEKIKSMSKHDLNNFLAHMYNKMMKEKFSQLPVPKIPDIFDISASDVAQYLNQEVKPFPNLYPGDIIIDHDNVEYIVLPVNCFYDTDLKMVIKQEEFDIKPENCSSIIRVLRGNDGTECKEIWHWTD